MIMLVVFTARRIKGMIKEQISALAETGNVAMASATNAESGFESSDIRGNHRIPIGYDGLRLVSFMPPEDNEGGDAL